MEETNFKGRRWRTNKLRHTRGIHVISFKLVTNENFLSILGNVMIITCSLFYIAEIGNGGNAMHLV